MLRKFEVTNYRNFKGKYTLDLSTSHDYRFNGQCIKDGLVNTGIVYAKNARGKTNLGRAIMDIRNNFTRQDNLSQRLSPDDIGFINADANCHEAFFSYFFDVDNHKIVYRYRKNQEQQLTSEFLEIDGNVVYDFDSKAKRMREAPNLSLIGAENTNQVFSDNEVSLLSYFSNTVPVDQSDLLFKLRRFISGMRLLGGLSTPWACDWAGDQIIRTNNVDKFKTFLKTYGVDEKLAVAPNADGHKDLFVKHANCLLPFSRTASSGTTMLATFFASYGMRARYSFLYLDEFDAHYHFELAEKLIKYLSRDASCQTIVTSHNTALLSNSIMRPDCFFIISPGKISSLADATDRELREGHNLEKLYRNGEFDEKSVDEP